MIPSTGEKIKTDSAQVTIPVSYIKLANKKLIERQMLIETNAYKDSIILDYKTFVNEQDKIINDFQNRLLENNKINEDLSKRLDKQKKISLICGTAAGASLAVIIVVALIK